MADDIELEFSVLNIVCDPHPPGIYPKILERISRKHTHLWGNEFVALTKPEIEEAGFFCGRVYVWTVLDRNAPAIDLDRLMEVRLENTKINVPDNMGLNGRIFTYILREKDHKIFVESRNEFGKHLSPDRLVNALEKLVYPINERGKLHVEITVQPEDDALERVLAIPRISTLEIHIRRPNPDDNDLDTEAILKELGRVDKMIDA